MSRSPRFVLLVVAIAVLMGAGPALAAGSAPARAAALGTPIIESVNGIALSPAVGNTSTPSVVVSGVVEGDIVRVFDGATLVATKTVDPAATTVSFPATDVALAGDGDHTLTATSTGAVASPASAAFIYTLDTGARAPASVSTSPAANATVQAATTVSATFDERLDRATSTLTVRSMFTAQGPVTLGPDGKTIIFTPTSPLGGFPPMNFYTAQADVRDGNGNLTSLTWTFSVDASPPAPPVITSVQGDPTSPAAGNDATPTIVVGNVFPGDTVRILDGGTVRGVRTVPGDQSPWSVGTTVTFNVGPADSDVTLTGDTDHVLTATATDPAGNVSTASPDFVYALSGIFAGQFHSLSPTRILDTRVGTGDFHLPVGAGTTIAVAVTGRGGVPETGVAAVAVNVTATEPSAAGFLTIFPTGANRPTSSNLNFAQGETVPNLVVSGVGTDGTVSVYNQSGTTHVLFDVVGWYSDAGGPAGARYTALSPSRVLDTRTVAGGNAPVGPDSTIVADVTGVGGVPASGVSAVVLNVTATQPSAGGHFTVFPSGTTRPVASSLNFVRGETVPNLVVAKVGADGAVSVYNRAGTTHVILDVVGWFGGDADRSGALFNALTPARILDSRTGIGRLSSPVGPGATVSIAVAGQGGVPITGVNAVVLNVTATQPTSQSHLTIFPSGTTRPVASSLNFVGGQTVANLVVAKVGADGRVNVYNSSGTTHVIFDVMGWYAP